MLLIDEPYVSDFLIDTLKKYHFPVIATPVARKLIQEEALHWVTVAEAVSILENDPDLPLYSISENGLDWVVQHFPERTLSRQISVLKDKIRFRELLTDLFPDFYFRAVSVEDIRKLDVGELPLPLVIKPSIGFFSIGVHIVHHEEDWQAAQRALQAEKLSSIFPESVLDTRQFIIEEYISGEEYAIDYYHDREGKVVILNILHHIFSSGTDTSDRVYTTSKDIITAHQNKMEDFLGKIGKALDLKNFPAHAEVRIDEAGRVQPIEINPLRFGGWCTTGDLLGLSLGLNAYDYFFRQKRPDWDALFQGKEDKLFSIIVLDNSSGIANTEIAGFDYTKLAGDLENPLVIRELDIKEYPIFGFVFAETSAQNTRELQEILTSDLKRYIK